MIARSTSGIDAPMGAVAEVRPGGGVQAQAGTPASAARAPGAANAAHGPPSRT
jgi:hypothetical protein